MAWQEKSATVLLGLRRRSQHSRAPLRWAGGRALAGRGWVAANAAAAHPPTADAAARRLVRRAMRATRCGSCARVDCRVVRVHRWVGAGLQRMQEQHVSHVHCICSAACMKGDAAHALRFPVCIKCKGTKVSQPKRGPTKRWRHVFCCPPLKHLSLINQGRWG